MKKVLLITSLFALPVSAAQTCLTNMPDTSPDTNFTVNDTNGTAVDNTTGLMWSRCAMGQSWNADTMQCTGTGVQLNWQEALQQSFINRYAGYDDWRLPNIKELMSIVERKCAQPSINITVFSDATSNDFWSSTANLSNASEAWTIAFHNGSNTATAKTAEPFIRLVRTNN